MAGRKGDTLSDLQDQIGFIKGGKKVIRGSVGRGDVRRGVLGVGRLEGAVDHRGTGVKGIENRLRDRSRIDQ